MTAGCDPCEGVLGCTVAPSVAASGRVIDFASGRGVAGARVDFVPSDSSAGAISALTATTDADGLFRISGTVRGLRVGAVTGAVTITPPAATDVPYSVGNVSLPINTLRGSGVVLPTWFTHPYLYALGSIHRASDGAAAAGVAVTYTRTGGAPVSGGGFTTLTNGSGQFLMQQPGQGADSSFGTYTFAGGNLPRAYVLQDAPYAPLLSDVLPPQPTVYYDLGAALAGSVRLLTPAGKAVTGATVTFRRTGGIALASDVVNALTLTNVNGDADLPLRPAVDTAGAVVGTLVVQLPDGSTRTFAVTYQTVDADIGRRLGTYTISGT